MARTVGAASTPVLQHRRHMRERTDDDRRGVLRTPPPGAFALRRWDPSPALAPFADFHWVVTWDLRGRPPHTQVTLAHPAADVVVEEGRARLYGPARRRFERTLRDRGRVVATRLRRRAPAACSGVRSPRSPTASSTCRGRGWTARLWRPRSMRRASPRTPSPCVDAALVSALPAPPDPAGELAALGAAAAGGRPPPDPRRRPGRRAGRQLALAAAAVRRPRRGAAGRGRAPAAPAGGGRRGDLRRPGRLGAPAADLGYCDQAHLVRDFAAAVGTPPARYATAG